MSSEKRKPTACRRCHRRKVKCSGGVPCQNCQNAGIPCTFPYRDRNVVVSEAYIRHLQAMAQIPREAVPSMTIGMSGEIGSRTGQLDNQPATPSSQGNHERRASTLTLKHATAEAFVSGLRKLSAWDVDSLTDRIPTPEFYSEGSNEVSNYDYASLSFDTSSSSVSIALPPYPYAVQLISQFESFMAYEYHWYCRRDFHSTLEATYQFPDSAKARSRTWLCKLLAVLALGESFNSYEPPVINLGRAADTASSSVMQVEERGTKSPHLPGTRFFEQALSLFKMPSEEPEVEHVEALNLISFYCYSLNRRKTAYMYAGISTRIASNLRLHKPARSGTAVLTEHWKRVWWTTFLIDSMVSAEMGLRAAFSFAQAEHSLPSDDHLTPTEREEFWDAHIMTAHLRLCNIRGLILETLAQLQETDFATYEKAMEIPLRELDTWKRELPQDIAFDFLEGVPQEMLNRPSMRSLASCYLRYHQGYIMLIRPVFFKFLSIVLGKDGDMSSIDELIDMSSRCLDAAKCNMRILTTLSSTYRLAKYGFYDSLHLFSGIKIFSLSRLANTIRPLSLVQDSQDTSLYSTAKELLMTMASSGNLAAKGHVQMLQDIERLLDVVSQSQDAQQILNVSLEEIFPWVDPMGGSEYSADSIGN